ncbi:uncharacterized protein LOC143284897 [Babylonia areolata]|uniref:uncharacterized protein LOC143284897 n=1 Tax=Babylonia areolata TaxID=304850 RepID=UPI003FCFD81F
MAGGGGWWRISVLVLGLLGLRAWTLDIIDVDMTGLGCSDTQEREVTNSQMYTLHADYPAESPPTSTVCSVRLKASDSTSSLLYTVQQFSGLADCGWTLVISEDPQISSTLTRTLTCGEAVALPVQGEGSRGKLQFSVRRNGTHSSALQLRIQVTASAGYVEVTDTAFADRLTGDGGDTDDPPTPTDNNEGEGGSLNVGVVVGIAIAGIILIIALVGLAIYCCLRNRNEDIKDMEAGEARSGTSVFTSGTSQVLFAGNQRKSGGTGGKYGSMEDVRSSSSTDRANNLYSNRGYQADGDETRSDRESRGGGYKNTAFADESDRAVERGGHLSRRDSGGRGGGKYDKKKAYSRNEEYEMSKVSKVPNGILKTRSKSPNRSQSSTEGSTVDSNALVYGYSQTTHAHPNTQHIPVLERTRSRSRSRGTSSHRSGSAGRSRSGSVGKSSGKDMKAPKTSRQYSDMSHFLEKQKERPRSRSGSVGRRARSDSKTSDHTPSEVSFAPSGASSKKNTGGRRVHIQSVETDF